MQTPAETAWRAPDTRAARDTRTKREERNKNGSERNTHSASTTHRTDLRKCVEASPSEREDNETPELPETETRGAKIRLQHSAYTLRRRAPCITSDAKPNLRARRPNTRAEQPTTCVTAHDYPGRNARGAGRPPAAADSGGGHCRPLHSRRRDRLVPTGSEHEGPVATRTKTPANSGSRYTSERGTHAQNAQVNDGKRAREAAQTREQVAPHEPKADTHDQLRHLSAPQHDASYIGTTDTH